MSGFSFIQISDHHLGDSEQTTRKGFLPTYAFRAVMRDIAEKWQDQVDFIVSTGDLVLGGSAPEYQFVCRMLDLQAVSRAPGPQRVTIGGLKHFPMYFTPGNHDDAKTFCRILFNQELSTERMHVSFRHKGVHFVCPDWGPELDGVAPDTPPDLVQFLHQTITSDEPTILLLHYAPLILKERWSEAFLPQNIERFWRAIQGKKNILAIFSGHIHQNWEMRYNGLPVYGVASTCYQHLLHEGVDMRVLLPLAYRVVRVQDGAIQTQLCEVDLPLGEAFGLSKKRKESHRSKI